MAKSAQRSPCAAVLCVSLSPSVGSLFSGAGAGGSGGAAKGLLLGPTQASAPASLPDSVARDSREGGLLRFQESSTANGLGEE